MEALTDFEKWYRFDASYNERYSYTLPFFLDSQGGAVFVRSVSSSRFTLATISIPSTPPPRSPRCAKRCWA